MDCSKENMRKSEEKNAVDGASRCRAGRFIELELLLKGFSIEWGTSMSCLRGSSGRCDRTSPTQAHAKRNAEYSRVSTRFLSWRSEGFEAANIDKYWAMFSGKHGNRAGLNCTATVQIDSGLLRLLYKYSGRLPHLWLQYLCTCMYGIHDMVVFRPWCFYYSMLWKQFCNILHN